MNLNKLITTWKFRWDISVSFMTIINFILLSITASAPIQIFLNSWLKVSVKIYYIVVALIVVVMSGTLCFGYLLDRAFKYWENISTIQNEKNPQITEILKNSRAILDYVKAEGRMK